MLQGARRQTEMEGESEVKRGRVESWREHKRFTLYHAHIHLNVCVYTYRLLERKWKIPASLYFTS